VGTSSGTELNFFPRQEKLSKKQAKKERAEEEKVGMEKQIAEALKMFQAQMQLQQAQLSAAASTAAAAPGPGSKSTQLAVLGSIPGGAPATGAFAPAANTAATNPPPNFAGAMVAQVREREREREREGAPSTVSTRGEWGVWRRIVAILEQACNGITVLVEIMEVVPTSIFMAYVSPRPVGKSAQRAQRLQSFHVLKGPSILK